MDKNIVNAKALETDNRALEAAMKALASENNRENMANMMNLMRTARFLVPAQFPKNMDRQTAAKLAQGKPLQPGEGPRMTPLVVQSAMGEKFAPAFTSKEHLPKDQKYPVILNVRVEEILRVASEPSLKLSGIMLNPATDRMILHPQFIGAMKQLLQKPSDKKEIRMTREQFQAAARRNTEWGLLPKAVYTEKSAFMERLEEQREKLIAEYYRLPYGGKAPCPYTEEDFDVMILNIDAETCVASVELPAKLALPQAALSLYIVWNPQTDDMHYYMIEKGQPGQANVLCGITSDGHHQELQTAPASGNELAAVLELAREEE